MAAAIRLASPEDAAAVVSIYAPYVTDTSVTFEYDVPSVEEYRRRIEEIMQFFPFFLLEEDGVPVGYAYAHFFHPRKAYQWVCETTIYVERNHHKKGYASMLYGKLLNALKKQGFCEAIAILGCPNEPSEGFHKAMGFQLIGTFDKAGFKLDQWHDVKWYGLELRKHEKNPAEPVPYSAIQDK